MGGGSPKMDKKFLNVNITNFAEVYKGGRWTGGGGLLSTKNWYFAVFLFLLTLS